MLSALVIDDDESIRDILRKLLEVNGFYVFTASDGVDGLTLLRRIKVPSLILLDQFMPIMDSEGFLKAKAADSSVRDVPVIIISASKYKMLSNDVVAYFPKPLDLANLLIAVKKFAGSPGKEVVLSQSPAPLLPIFSLVYSSCATIEWNAEALKEILSVSISRNRQDHITGILIARKGFFLQLLEGPEEKVRACYARILADPRHCQITLQGEAFSAERLSKDWSMAFADTEGDNSDTVKSILTLFDLERSARVFAEPETLMFLLKHFCENVKMLALGPHLT